MHSSNTSPPEARSDAGHETSDVQVRSILWLAMGIIVIAVMVHIGLWVLWKSLQAGAASRDPVLSPLAETRPIPPAPRLQSAPIADYVAYRQLQNDLLNSYGWVDQERGLVRIPVSRAKDLLLERGWQAPEKPDSEAGENASPRDEEPKTEGSDQAEPAEEGVRSAR